MNARMLSGALALTLVLGGVVGCGKRLFGRDDLEVQLSRHHIDLRWGRLENAAQSVQPDMRAAFLTAWAARISVIELQDIDVTGIVMSDDGDSADVLVTLTYIDRDTMRVVTTPVSEKWVRTDLGWRASLPADLKPKA